MANFEIAFRKTSLAEGGYANNPKDTGGETYAGISRKNHPEWDGWNTIELFKKVAHFPQNLKSNKELQGQVESFYKINYWNIFHLDVLNSQQMANEIYDTGVNMGTGRSALFFQRVLNVAGKIQLALDAKIGTKTIGVFNSMSGSDQYMVWKLFNCLQGEKYIVICESNPSQEIFLRSWASRVFEQ